MQCTLLVKIKLESYCINLERASGGLDSEEAVKVEKK